MREGRTIKWMIGMVMAVMLVAPACGAQEGEEAVGPLSLQTLAENATEYHHKLVRVRGYLDSVFEGVFLLPQKPDDSIRYDPFFQRFMIGVIDNSPDSRLRFDYEAADPACSGHYAEIVGRFSYADTRLPYFLYETYEIRVWKRGQAFSGPGEVCFAKQDNHYPPSDFLDVPLRTRPNPFAPYRYPGAYYELHPEARPPAPDAP